MAMRLSKRLLPLVLAALAACGNAYGQVNADDETFLSLRDAWRRQDSARAAELAARLAQYPIPSYVEYYRLRTRLGSAPQAEIRDYLARHAGTAIGDRLRNDWLLWLGFSRDWATFDEQYPQFILNDDLQLKCYGLLSRAVKGQDVAAEARALLASPKDYGEGCPTLIATLVQNGQFTADDAWAQVRLAAENNYGGLARRLTGTVGASDAAMVQAFDRPAVLLGAGVGNGRAAHELFIVALGRVARTSVDQAAQVLERAAPKLTPAEQALGWAQVALQASLKAAPDAAAYWRRSGRAPLSQDGHQWKVRSALRAGDWKLVREAIEAMPASLQADAAWTYWKGRALKVQGQPEQAQALFQSVAKQWNFYGQLATEELGQKITVPPQATLPDEAEINAMAANPGFKRAIKFLELNMRFEAYREWNWQLRKMSDREYLAAAEYARRINLLDRMVNTSDRTRAEFDFTQRFPAPHSDLMHKATEPLRLDKAWVYGLIRQESRFVMGARSHVGASGLMQLMPATAKAVARKLGMRDYDHSRVNDIGTNIVLGTNYLNMVLGELDGSQALATAGYNAGPGRPRAWRSTLPRAVEGAIFAESIPFTETRNYVKSVLSNATYYAALFEGRGQSLRERLGMVAPKGYTPSAIVDAGIADSGSVAGNTLGNPAGNPAANTAGNPAGNLPGSTPAP
ncbi:MAG: lytic transglycosylase protein [Paucimonas sp.]|nr:lytic transglycosylase protein [Paucimonas sp.]